jgi:hypothetical protein
MSRRRDSAGHSDGETDRQDDDGQGVMDAEGEGGPGGAAQALLYGTKAFAVSSNKPLTSKFRGRFLGNAGMGSQCAWTGQGVWPPGVLAFTLVLHFLPQRASAPCLAWPSFLPPPIAVLEVAHACHSNNCQRIWFSISSPCPMSPRSLQACAGTKRTSGGRRRSIAAASICIWGATTRKVRASNSQTARDLAPERACSSARLSCQAQNAGLPFGTVRCPRVMPT